MKRHCIPFLIGALALAGCAEKASRGNADTVYAATNDMMAPGSVGSEPPPLTYSHSSLSGGLPYRDLNNRGMPDELANKEGEYFLDAAFTPEQAVDLFVATFRIPASFQRGVSCKVRKPDQSPSLETVQSPELAAALDRANGGAGKMAGQLRPRKTKMAISSKRATDIIQVLEEQFDLEARWTGTQLVFSDSVTETFLIKTTSLRATFGSTSSGSGQGQGNGSAGTASQEINLWGDIEKGVQQIAGSDACLHPVPGLGTLIFTGPPSIRNRVKAFVDPFNEVIGQQILVETTVIKVSVNDNSNFGLNLDVLFQASNNFSARLFGSIASSNQSVGGLATVTLPPTVVGGTSHFAGSSLIQRLADEEGRLSDVRNNKNVVTNGLPTRIDLSTTKRIIGDVDIGAISGGSDSVQTGARTEDIDIGFQLNVLPRVIGPNEIGLTMALSDSSIANERTRNVGQTSLDLFDRQRLATENYVNLQSGQTLVIAGLEQVIDQSNRQSNLFGFSRSGGQQKIRVILLVTPTLVPKAGKGPT